MEKKSSYTQFEAVTENSVFLKFDLKARVLQAQIEEILKIMSSPYRRDDQVEDDPLEA